MSACDLRITGGRIVDVEAPTDTLCGNPRHPSTRALPASVFTPETRRGL